MKKAYPIPEKIIFDDSPIGSIVSIEDNLKDSEPIAIPDEYELMDGSTVNDSESPLNGLALPNWNFEKNQLFNITDTTNKTVELPDGNKFPEPIVIMRTGTGGGTVTITAEDPLQQGFTTVVLSANGDVVTFATFNGVWKKINQYI